MESKLEILVLEDSPDDANLIARALRQGGISCSIQRVETREDFLRALEEQHPDIILADYRLPHFDGGTALKLAQERLPLTPVIIVTGALIDNDAVDLLREGASDYILKDRLSRLAPAVLRSLAEAEQARNRKAAELALRNSELRYRRLFESAMDGILILEGGTGIVVDVNPYLIDLLGCSREEIVGKRVSEIKPIRDVTLAEVSFTEVQEHDYTRHDNLPLRTQSGELIEVEVISNAYEVNGKKFIQCIIRDISERVLAEQRQQEQLSELLQFQRVTVDRELRLQELEMEIARLKKEGR